MDQEEPIEEIQRSTFNVTTRSKGPIMDESLLLPNIGKIQESMTKINSNTQTPPKSNLDIEKDKVTKVSNPMKVVESKKKVTRKFQPNVI